MSEECCVMCGNIIPEGRQVCWNCEQNIIKIGSILQSHNATEDDVVNAHEFINKFRRVKKYD